ncbi:MAG: hypothetical protein K9H16_11495 [Bacteroidales bacterium]|nr:hypothetical protein [Bacteroidales bacterium]
MKRYIEQLIEDLKVATLEAPDDPFDDLDLDDDEALEMELEEVERFENGPLEKLSDIVGIAKINLPEPGRLTENEMGKIVPELVNLLQAYNFFPEYPPAVPPGMIYRAIYNIWEDEFVRMSFGSVHIDFCDYEEENCPFPGYCNLCKENRLKTEPIPENEFKINANPLKGDESRIEDDFQQIEKEYYRSSALTDKEGFIPGIHNYCDRWCERCDFTDKCRVFAMEIEMQQMLGKSDDEENRDVNNAGNFLTDDPDDDFEYENPDAEIDFYDMMDESFEDDSDDFFSAENKADRHPLIELADQYTNETFNWFKEREAEMKRGFTAQLAQGNADEVLEAEDVLAWYHAFIYAKLRRALSGYYEMEEFEEAAYDMNGSAKVALIGIDRSIEATTILIRQLKSHREKTKHFRYNLEMMRNMAEELFPEARGFVRPGLDEI